MKPYAFKRVGTLVIAIALIATDATILCGQRNPEKDDSVFELPSNFVNKPNSQSATQPTPANDSTVGKARLGQASSVRSTKPTRPAIPGTEPKRLTPIPPHQAAATTSSTPKTVESPSAVRPAGYTDSTRGITADGADPLMTVKKPKRNQLPPTVMLTPPNQGNPPQITGSLVNLRGETATEKLIQMHTLFADLQRENDELRQQNAQLQAAYKERNEQLNSAISQIKDARREIGNAKVDLDRLKADIQGMRQKLQLSEKEHQSLLQSMGPLLQQLLDNSNDVSSLPQNPSE